MPSLKLYIQVYLFRAMQVFGTWIDQTFIKPRPIRPSFSISIPTTLSKYKGNIRLYFYLPAGLTRSNLPKKDFPLIANFHAGAFTIGNATDDARWATTVTKELGAIFVSVGYRKGPTYPQPTAVQDAVDALRYLWAHAEEFGFDVGKTVLTGFSSGASLCFSAPLMHYRELSSSSTDGKIAGIISFYPSVNHAIPRSAKIASNPLSDGREPAWLHTMVDASYYQDLPPEGRASVNLSPALASEKDLREALPQRIGLFTTEWDKLLVEGEEFKETLRELGKTVGGSMVKGVPHGFDKRPGKHVEEREAMYSEAIGLIKAMV